MSASVARRPLAARRGLRLLTLDGVSRRRGGGGGGAKVLGPLPARRLEEEARLESDVSDFVWASAFGGVNDGVDRLLEDVALRVGGGGGGFFRSETSV